jgi:hypothetical protein
MNLAYQTPPASGTEYVPLGPGLLEPPTKMMEQKLMRATNMSMGKVPAGQLVAHHLGQVSLPLYSPYHPSIRFVLLRVPNKEVRTGPDLHISYAR